MRKLKVFTVLFLAVAILMLLGAAPAFGEVTAQKDSAIQSNEGLIHIGYLSVLQRPDTPPEYVAWWDALQSGAVTRSGFASAIVNSHEKRYRVVLDFYPMCVGRNATDAEATAWANAMDAGLTWKSLRAKLMASAEFASTYGAVDNDAFITHVYQLMLNRGAATAEVNAWVAAMNAGVSRETVINLISSSIEFTYPFVNAQYDYYLGRDAGSSEKAMWGNAISSGAITEEDTVVGLVGSAEFFYYWSLFARI